MNEQDYLFGDFYPPARVPSVCFDPDVLASVDYEDATKLEKKLLKEREEAQQKYREHDERIKELLAMAEISPRKNRKAAAFVKNYARIREKYIHNWRPREKKLKKRWRYRAILASFAEPYCESFEARRLAEVNRRIAEDDLEGLRRAVAQGEEKKRDFLWMYYRQKLSATATYYD